MRQVRTTVHRREDKLLRTLPDEQRRALKAATHTIERALGRS
jgi:hypothetical protein